MIRYFLWVLLIAFTAIAGILAQEVLYPPQEHTVQTSSFYFEAQNHTLKYVVHNNTEIEHDVLNVTYQNGTLKYNTNHKSPSTSAIFFMPSFAVALVGFVWLIEDDKNKKEGERNEL